MNYRAPEMSMLSWRATTFMAGLAVLCGGGLVLALSVAGPAAAGGMPTCHGRAATIVGTPGEDVFEQDQISDGDVLVLRAGADRVESESRNVTVCGGAGSDDITAHPGTTGRRTLFDGDPGDDLLVAGSLRGRLRDVGVPVRFLGGPGDDGLVGGGADDRLKAGPADDPPGDLDRDAVHGDRGADLIKGGDDADELRGGAGNDSIIGGRSGVRYGDFADGGLGRGDRCRAEVKRNCER
jgi:Ca2+-binding RTX toxin-like protein